MKDLELTPHGSVAEYFHEMVGEALRNQGVAASAHAEFYLVNLLSEYCHTPLSDQPLSLLLAEASEGEPALRARKLRAVGDQSLYVSGFFADSLARKLVDTHYYISIGALAYRTLARMYAAPPWGQTYQELSGKFTQLVDVLGEVAARGQFARDSGVVQLYERYLRTGSEFLRRRLQGLGVTGIGSGGTGGPAS